MSRRGETMAEEMKKEAEETVEETTKEEAEEVKEETAEETAEETVDPKDEKIKDLESQSTSGRQIIIKYSLIWRT